MNGITHALSRFARQTGAAVKGFAMRWGGYGRTVVERLVSGRSRFNYALAVGDGRGNAIVLACILWLCRTFPEAPIRVQTRKADGELEPDPRHPLVQLLHQPNDYYSGILLWTATIGDWMLGNAYWVKVRSGAGRVVQLWWVPSSAIDPKWPADGTVFISHYEYTVEGRKYRLEREDVVHFRNGLDPENPRKGLSPLGALMREIFTDDEAANFSASLLRNLGVPGVLISPEGDVEVDQADAEKIKGEFEQRFGNDNRGRAMVLSNAVKTQVLSFNPQQMDLKMLRRVPEERVSAILGTPAVVVGLGAGLDRSTFANFKEAREAAYEGNVIPTQRFMAAELTTQLLPDFGDPERLVMDFDLTQVRVLQEDQDALSKRVLDQLWKGAITRGEAREKLGYDQDEEGDVYLMPGNIVAVPVGQLTAPKPAPAAPPQLPAPRAVITELPPEPKALPAGETKAADADTLIGRAVRRQRATHAVSLQGEVAAYFRGLASRVASRYTAAAGKSGGQQVAVKDEAPTLTEEEFLALLPDEDVAAFRELLRVMAIRVGEATYELVSDQLGIAVSFDLEAPEVVRYLAQSGTRVQGITDTTRAAMRQALQDGQAAGEGVTQIAKRLRGSVEETYKGRSLTIAATEVGEAQNRAAILGYRQSGLVTTVRVLDGVDDDDACRAANGQEWSLDYAEGHALQHPNCQRAWSPIVREE